MEQFFIMMKSQDGKSAAPILRDEDNGEQYDTAFYDTRKKAEDAIKDHTFCKAWGYEIFSINLSI